MIEQPYLTAEGAKRLREELEHLTGPVRIDLAKRLRSAIQMGDLSENADYKAAKEEQGFIEGRILELEHVLRYAIIIEENEDGFNEVSIGAKVTVQETDYPPETYLLVGVKETDPRNGRISYESPIGGALMGKKVGDKIEVSTPGGSIQMVILDIE